MAKRRRRAAKNAPILNRVVYCKCKSVRTIPLMGNQNTATSLTYSFARCQPASIFNDQYGFDSGARFQAMKNNWEQMAVTGMKLEYIPTNRVTMFNTAVNLAIGGIDHVFTFDDIDTFNTNSFTDDTIAQKETFRSHDPMKPFTIYRNNKPICRQMQAKWIDPTNYSSVAVNKDLPQASVGFRLQGTLVSGSNMAYGWLKLTHYITFRGQRISGG